MLLTMPSISMKRKKRVAIGLISSGMFLYVLKVENYALCTIRLQNKQKKMKQANFLSKNASKSLQVRLCKHMRHLFPDIVSYNRFVELERGVAIPPLRVCRNQRNRR